MRLIALNMALDGTPRKQTARFLAENFSLEDSEQLLDQVYASAGVEDGSRQKKPRTHDVLAHSEEDT